MVKLGRHLMRGTQNFAFDPCNVRPGLALDGFNSFGNMSNTHSTWPIMLVPYNLRHWMIIRQSSIMLSVIIPGPSSTERKIDIY
jgi:hypothetical protein